METGPRQRPVSPGGRFGPALRLYLAFPTCILTLTSLWTAPPIVAGGVMPQVERRGVNLASLPVLPGQRSAVRYAPGSLDRAHHVLMRLEVVTYYYNKWGGTPVPIAAYVLSRDEWERLRLRRPYGFPIRTGPTGVMVAALGDEGTVALWRRLLATRQLPMVPGIPLQGTAEEAATMALGDVLLQVETARGFVQQAGLLGDVPWTGEVLAHLAALTVFHIHEKPRLGEIDGLYERLVQKLGGIRAFPLAYFRQERPAEEWLWFQAQFYRGARLIYDKDGKKAVNRLLKISRGTGGRVDEAALLAAYPALSRWLENSFR